MKQTFQVPAYLTGASFKADGGMSLRFSTQELSVEDKVKAGEFVNQYGWLLFSANEFKDDEVPTENAPVDGWKTPSQRLRGVLYVLWSEKKEGEFNTFYVKKMEEIIEHFKGKIEK
jgi:hypothetical protein